MNLNQLRALDALETTRSFTGAADRLGLTQPAVSVQLRKLQEQHGVKLFWRCGRYLEFSDLGNELILKARKILRLVADFEETLKSASCLRSGRLAIGLSCHHFVMDLLSTFMARYPGVQVRARIGDSDELIEAVKDCRLDLAGVTGTEPDTRLFSLPYCDQSIVLFVSIHHPWAKRPYLDAATLNNQPMVARPSGSMTRQIFERRLARQSIRPRVVMELDSWEALKEAVAAAIGFGIALEDEFAHDSRLVGVPVRDMDLSAGQFFVCLPEFEKLQAVQAFFDLVGEIKNHRQAQRTAGHLDLPAGALRQALISDPSST
jgi:aminoethylphosphonate catabolism LysR family transcriptional regulator